MSIKELGFCAQTIICQFFLNLIMNWSVSLLLFVFCLQSVLTRGQNRSPWPSPTVAEKWMTYFLQSLTESTSFTFDEIDSMVSVGNALLASLNHMVRSGRISVSKMQAMNKAFASSVAEMVVLEAEGSNLMEKRDAVVNAIYDAYMKTTGSVNQKFLNEIRQLINMFSQIRRNENIPNSEKTAGTDGYGAYGDRANESSRYSYDYTTAQRFNGRTDQTQKYSSDTPQNENQMNKKNYNLKTYLPRILSSESSIYLDKKGQYLENGENRPNQDLGSSALASSVYSSTNTGNSQVNETASSLEFPRYDRKIKRNFEPGLSSSKTTAYNTADLNYDNEGYDTMMKENFPLVSDSKTNLRSDRKRYGQVGRFSSVSTMAPFDKRRRGLKRKRFRLNQATEFSGGSSDVFNETEPDNDVVSNTMSASSISLTNEDADIDVTGSSPKHPGEYSTSNTAISHDKSNSIYREQNHTAYQGKENFVSSPLNNQGDIRSGGRIYRRRWNTNTFSTSNAENNSVQVNTGTDDTRNEQNNPIKSDYDSTHMDSAYTQLPGRTSLPSSLEPYDKTDLKSTGTDFAMDQNVELHSPLTDYDEESTGSIKRENIPEQEKEPTSFSTIDSVFLEGRHKPYGLQGSPVTAASRQERPSFNGWRFVPGTRPSTSAESTFNQVSQSEQNNFNRGQDKYPVPSQSESLTKNLDFKDKIGERDVLRTKLSRTDYTDRGTNGGYLTVPGGNIPLDSISSSSTWKDTVSNKIQRLPDLAFTSKVKPVLTTLLNSVPNNELLAKVISNIYFSIINNNPGLSECELSIRVLSELIAALVQNISSFNFRRMTSSDFSASVVKNVPSAVC